MTFNKFNIPKYISFSTISYFAIHKVAKLSRYKCSVAYWGRGIYVFYYFLHTFSILIINYFNRYPRSQKWMSTVF